MKKIISIFLTLAMLLGLVSCGEIEGGIEGVYRNKNGTEGYYQFYKDGNYYRDAETFKDNPKFHKELDIDKGTYSVKDSIITVKYENGNEDMLYVFEDYLYTSPFAGNLNINRDKIKGKVEWHYKYDSNCWDIVYNFFDDGTAKKDFTTDLASGKEERDTGTYEYNPENGIIVYKTENYTDYSMLKDGVFYGDVFEKVKE